MTCIEINKVGYHTTWDAATELTPDAADGHKSFYRKAYARRGSALTPECEYIAIRELYSYGTKVAAVYYVADGDPILIIGRPHLFSATTSRHFRSFTRQYLNGIAYGIKDIRKTWKTPDNVIVGNVASSLAWDKSFADFYGYRF